MDKQLWFMITACSRRWLLTAVQGYVCVRFFRVCAGKMRGESMGNWDHWYADYGRKHYDEQVPLIRKQNTELRKMKEKNTFNHRSWIQCIALHLQYTVDDLHKTAFSLLHFYVRILLAPGCVFEEKRDFLKSIIFSSCYTAATVTLKYQCMN